jgi:hypothetical protein
MLRNTKIILSLKKKGKVISSTPDYLVALA